MGLKEAIEQYFKERGLVLPNIWESLAWATTELAEVYEVILSRKEWVRNNPEKHSKKTKEDLAEELGDVILMLMVAGSVEGVDPIEALYNKMERKLGKTTTGTSPLEETTLEDYEET